MQKTTTMRQSKVANDSGPEEAQTVGPPRPREYHDEEQIGFIIRRAHQRCSLIFQQIMTGSEIGQTRFAALVKGARQRAVLAERAWPALLALRARIL